MSPMSTDDQIEQDSLAAFQRFVSHFIRVIRDIGRYSPASAERISSRILAARS